MIEYFHISSNESRGEYSFKQVSLWNFDLFFSFSSTLKRLWAKLYFIQFQKINIIPFRGNCWKKLWKLGKIFPFWRKYWQGIKWDKQIKKWMQKYSPLIWETIFSSIQDHLRISSSLLCESTPFSVCQQEKRTKTWKYLWQFPLVQSYSK